MRGSRGMESGRRVRAASDAHRRGTVLLFALGVLAVIAIAAVSYVTFVRVDRQSAEVTSRGIGFQGQVDVVTEHMRDLVAADKFGNKIVTRDVPTEIGQSELWPRMFEDAEYRDYPWTEFRTFDRTRRDEDVNDNDPSVLNLLNRGEKGFRFEVAPRDDAWLASAEPAWQVNNRHFWPQITNLRSAYTFDDNGTQDRADDDRYVRGDGLYVDLGQFFLDYLDPSKLGNPGTDLLDWDLGLSAGEGVVFPEDAAGRYENGGEFVAPYEQIWFLDEDREAVLQKEDERFWADTDGDLRPDARWQVLEQLGDFNGLVWVVAARIVDASSMLNYNTSVDGGYGSLQTQYYGTGRTPSDIDLVRLIATAQFDPFSPRRYDGSISETFADIRTDGFEMEDAFNTHILSRNATQDLLAELEARAVAGGMPPGSVPTLPLNWRWDKGNNRLDQRQRDLVWNWVGSSPFEARLDLRDRGIQSTGYSRSDLVDLHGYWGTNHRSFLSEIEETMDTGFLPDPKDYGPDGRFFGPMASATVGSKTRYLGTGFTGSGLNSEGRPTAAEVRWGTRRLLTPVSGSSLVSPVPVLNLDEQTLRGDLRYAPRFRNEKIRLRGFDASMVPEAFEALVWALAPLATDEPLSADLGADGVGIEITGRNIGPESSYHYGGTLLGGGVGGPAETLPGFEVQAGGLAGASFGVLTPAQIATNLADATDEDDQPTVARLLVATDQLASGGVRDCPSTEVIELGVSFSHGDIPSGLLSTAYLGDFYPGSGQDQERECETGGQNWLDNSVGQRGMTIVGLERHPYIVEVFSAAAYTTVSGDPRAGGGRACTEWNNRIDDPFNPNYQVGALLAFQLTNPWDTEIPLGDYELRLMKGKNLDPTAQGPDSMLVFGFQTSDVLPKNSSQTYLYLYDSMAGAVVDPIIGEIDDPGAPGGGLTAATKTIFDDRGVAGSILANSPAAIDKVIELKGGFDPQSKPVFFQDLADSDARVVLIRTGVPALGGQGAVVDRLENDSAAGAFPVVLPPAGYSFTAQGGGPLTELGYFETVLGYNMQQAGCPMPFGEELVRDRYLENRVNGRVVVTGSLSRPLAQSGSGFPMGVMDFGADGNALYQNVATDASDFVHAWLENYVDGPDQDPVTDCDNDPFSVNPGGSPPGLPTGDLAGTVGNPKEFYKQSTLRFETRKPFAEDGAPGGKSFPHTGPFDWQLFVPNDELYAVSDLGLISTYAHLCRNHDLTNLDAWQTVGEQLARSLYYDFTVQATDIMSDGGGSAALNPYVGVLDLSRHVPTGSVMSAGVPDESLALPLAVRVFDCFEGLETWDDESLVHGRVNANTASERVLETLPLLAPAAAIPGTSLAATLERVKLMHRYRDGAYPGEAFLTPADVTLLDGVSLPGPLRRSDLIDDPEVQSLPATGRLHPSGFATAGELAILDQWQANGEVVSTDGFVAALGKDGANDGPPADVWFTGVNDPTNDAEERLAIYRSVANLVSSRSDVYIAWFVLRGYDPSVIEAIPVEDGREIEAMEHDEPEFLPAYESRWMVVLDRSNVERPTDRPRVIFQAELPSAKP